MTRPIGVEENEQNQRIEEGINGVKSGLYKDCMAAAKALNVPYSTLNHRFKGRPTRVQAHENQQLLSEEEETELARWIRQLAVQGYPPKPYAVSNKTRPRNKRCLCHLCQVQCNWSTMVFTVYGSSS